jgi:hypothetical protein
MITDVCIVSCELYKDILKPWGSFALSQVIIDYDQNCKKPTNLMRCIETQDVYFAIE